MILGNYSITKAISEGRIVINPFDPKKLNPNSYNLSVGDEYIVYSVGEYIDPRNVPRCEKHKIPDSGLIIQPNKLYLVGTREYTETHGYVPMIEGRSSYGRLGLFVHVTAGFGDAGFCGHWTLELMAIYPFLLRKNETICQIYYHTVEGCTSSYKSSKYQHNTGVQPCLLPKEED